MGYWMTGVLMVGYRIKIFRGEKTWDSCQIGSRIWNEKWKIAHILQTLCRELQLEPFGIKVNIEED